MSDDVTRETAQRVLAVKLPVNDAGAETVRDYLIELLAKVWDEGESFSGKRPFGNSSWEYEVYAGLGKAGMITATFDEDGFIEEADTVQGDKLILAAIRELGRV